MRYNQNKVSGQAHHEAAQPPLSKAKRSADIIVCGAFKVILAATYFPGGLPLEYRRREWVSLPCSGWERVGHHCYDHQKLCTEVISD